MGRIGDIADLVTGLALLGGGYLIYKAVKEGGELIPEFPVFEWPEFPGWPDMPGLTLPDIPGIGDDEGVGGGGGGVRNGNGSNGNGSYIPLPELPGPAPPSDEYIQARINFGLIDLTKGLGRIYPMDSGLFGFRKAPGLEFGTRREARKYLKAQEWIL